MSLCGEPDGPPVVPSRDYGARALELCASYDRAACEAGADPCQGLALLAERAAALGFGRNGAVSANGTCHTFETLSGPIVINLARSEDVDLLEAWLRSDGVRSVDAVRSLAATMSGRELVDWGRMLGLPVAVVPAEPVLSGPIAQEALAPIGRARHRQPMVVDLSSLWAGPLCGNLLRHAGARVIKVEDRRRLDGARGGNRRFFDRMNCGKESLTLDFTDPSDLRFLANLIAKSDLVIEGSRPRALIQLGIDRRALLAENDELCWLSITAYGREGELGGWIGFGDDVAIGAGLLERSPHGIALFVGDAIADPLTGIAAGAAALSAMNRRMAGTIDISMAAVAGFVASAERLVDCGHLPAVFRQGDSWQMMLGEEATEISGPRALSAASSARQVGADNDALRGEFG